VRRWAPSPSLPRKRERGQTTLPFEQRRKIDPEDI